MNPFALVYLLAHMTPALIGFLAMILYSHLLSPAEYGVYVIGLSGAGVVSAIFFTWVRLSVSRYQARTPDVDLRHVAAIAYAATALVISVASPIAILIIRPNVSLEILAGSLFLSLTLSAFEITQEFRRAKLNPARFATLAIVRSTLGLGLGLAAISLGGGGLGLLLGVAASFLIANLATYLRTLTRAQRLYSSEYLTQFARYGLPFSLGAITFALHNSLDRLGIAYLLGESAAGQYGLAAEMSRQLIGILGASAASAMFPIAFRTLAESGPAATRARLAEGAELILALIVPVAIWLAIAGNVVAGTLLGAQFQSAVAMVLPLLALGRMCGAVNQLYLQVSFQLAEKPLLQVVHDTLLLVVNLALLFPLTLVYGLAGTAAAVLIAEAFGILVGVLLSRRAFRLPFIGGAVTRVFAATVFMAVVTYAAKTALAGHGLATLASVALLGGVSYAGAAILFNVAGIRATLELLLRGSGSIESVLPVRHNLGGEQP
ncbi:MAG: lipopolysaccharide biosynthesis protein [Hyphomicrobiales bacterium]|nr:lipopolysaccharide biosynthesis protein [Hyphomicrobiales bacterium]